MFNIVLVAPEIPPNTGNVIRLAANTGCTAASGRAAGVFDWRTGSMRRAGLDYHEYAAAATPRQLGGAAGARRSPDRDSACSR
jgi:tRNA (cytidine/uridine-2'-O-)-methyltransferase